MVGQNVPQSRPKHQAIGPPNSYNGGMKTYLVGGAVRDKLLELPIKERDWVVVGGSVEQMLELGFRKVGKDFPVFLHPKNSEEYALARTERKSGSGYYGFEVHASPDVTLEEDLLRRDLTINAMAMDDQQQLVDPYGGQRDLEERVLRHISPAFAEDPLRVLRVARFAARYHHLGFTIAPETAALLSQIVAADELPHLSIERVWVEMEKALGTTHPEVFFHTLSDCQALAVLLPELSVSQGIAALARAAPHTPRLDCRWASLLSDLPEARVKAINQHLKVPNAYSLLATRVSAARPTLKNALRDATECMALIKLLDALRRDEPFEGVCETLIALEQNSDEAKTTIELLRNACEQARTVTAADFTESGLTGPDLGAAIEAARIEQIREVLP